MFARVIQMLARVITAQAAQAGPSGIRDEAVPAGDRAGAEIPAC